MADLLERLAGTDAAERRNELLERAGDHRAQAAEDWQEADGDRHAVQETGE
jgi:hypothetical protein